MGVVQLKTNLRLFEAVTIIIGSMIGSGILILPGQMLDKVADPNLVIIAWVAGAFLTAMGALTFAEMASMYPRAGGQYHFLKEGLSPFWSYLFGWTMFWVVMSGIVAGVAVAFSNFVDYFVELPGEATQLGSTGLTLPAWGNAYVAVGLILFLSYVNYLSTKLGGRISNITVLGKYIGLVSLVVILFFLGDRHPEAFMDAIPEGTSSTSVLMGFGAALSLTLFAYDGWPQATYVASEIKNPKKNVPLALLIGPLLTAIIYILLTVAYFYVIPAGEGAEIGRDSESRIAIEAALAAVGENGAAFIAAVALVSVFGTVNNYVLTSPRIFYAMATDGALLRGMSKLSEKRATPAYAAAIFALWSSILAMTGLYLALVTMVVFGLWLFYIPTAIAHMRLRKVRPDLERPFKTPLFPIVPIIFLLSALYVTGSLALGTEGEYVAIALLVILTGIPFYYLQRRQNERRGLPAGADLEADVKVPRKRVKP